MKYIMRTFVATLILGSIDVYGRDWSCNQFGSIPDIDEEWHYIKRCWENSLFCKIGHGPRGEKRRISELSAA